MLHKACSGAKFERLWFLDLKVLSSSWVRIKCLLELVLLLHHICYCFPSQIVLLSVSVYFTFHLKLYCLLSLFSFTFHWNSYCFHLRLCLLFTETVIAFHLWLCLLSSSNVIAFHLMFGWKAISTSRLCIGNAQQRLMVSHLYITELLLKYWHSMNLECILPVWYYSLHSIVLLTLL